MICLGVGAAPDAVADPHRLTQLIMEGLTALEKAVGVKKTVKRKKAAPKRRSKSN